MTRIVINKCFGGFSLSNAANPVGADNIRGTMDRFLQEVNSVA